MWILINSPFFADGTFKHMVERRTAPPAVADKGGEEKKN